MARHGLILPFEGTTPTLGEGARVMPGAVVIGDVVLGPRASVWFNCVLRGDVHRIRVGAGTNIQDGSVLHVTDSLFDTVVGANVTVGHKVLLHGCEVGDRCLVGMGSTVLDGAVLEDEVFLAAGSLVTPGTRLPSGTLCRGRPARPVRELSDELRAQMLAGAGDYRALMVRYGAVGRCEQPG